MVDESAITHYITSTFEGVEVTTNFGYTFFFYRDDHRMAFATLVSADNEYDRISNLDRPGVFRLNLGVSRQTFQSLFGAGSVEVSDYDYTALDTIMPHPDYAPQSYICVLCPSDATFQAVQSLLAEAYELARRRYARRKPADTP